MPNSISARRIITSAAHHLDSRAALIITPMPLVLAITNISKWMAKTIINSQLCNLTQIMFLLVILLVCAWASHGRFLTIETCMISTFKLETCQSAKRLSMAAPSGKMIIQLTESISTFGSKILRKEILAAVAVFTFNPQTPAIDIKP